MILQTAINHFNEDIQRAKELKNFADGLAAGTIKDDILRAAWMMGVGALDAYFCDAYGDLLARTFRAKKGQPNVQPQLGVGYAYVAPRITAFGCCMAAICLLPTTT